MTQSNVWIALRDDADFDMDGRLNHQTERDGEYNGPITAEEAKQFQSMQDRKVIQGLFRHDAFGGRTWTLYSLYFDPETVMQEVATLRAKFGPAIKTLAGWEWDGTRLLAFPLNTRLLEFLPDIVTYDEDGNETSRTRPTVATDVNKRFGQGDRSFA